MFSDTCAPPIRVMALHALLYCQRLFYLEEVEEIRVADARVYAGRELHAGLDDDQGEWTSIELESKQLGLIGKVDCLKRAKVWLSENGRKKAIGLFETRLQETWKHPVVNYSLSYRRTIELDTRLLEKEWTGEPGLFARLRLR